MGNAETTERGGVRSTETAGGAQDVYSCDQRDASSADHLVLMVHGIFGSPSDWKYGAEQFVQRFPNEVIVHCSEKNTSMLSLDGIDVMGERLAEEVLEVVKRNPQLKKISFVAHSLGGLMSRYAIGKLYKSPCYGESVNMSTGESKGTIAGLKPINFITVATPHLGSSGNKQIPFLFGFTALERALGSVVHLMFRRTGTHLFLKDEEDKKLPLLRRMVEDNGEYPFMSALRSFKHRVAYSNADYDHIVGWSTSSIRRISELPKWEDAIDEKYPHIVYQEFCEANERKAIESTELANDSDEQEEELITRLSSVSWKKVDVSFNKCRFRLAAHNLIQVQDNYMHFEGADVIQHLMDHFLLGM